MISGDVDSRDSRELRDSQELRDSRELQELRDMGPSLDAFIELEVIDLPITIYELDDFEAALLAFLFSLNSSNLARVLGERYRASDCELTLLMGVVGLDSY